MPKFKWKNIGLKTFDFVFIGYVQNSAAYRFMSLNDFSICEFRDAKFFEQVFPLKKNVSTTLLETIPMHDNMPMFAPTSIIGDLVNETRWSK